MNPYLNENNNPTELLHVTLNYYGISLEEFKRMSDGEIRATVQRFSDALHDGRAKKK